MKVCPNCGHSSEKDNFCPYCGNPMMEELQKEKEKTCPKCGRALKSDMDYCPYCGKDLTADEFDNFYENTHEKEEFQGNTEGAPYKGYDSDTDSGFRVCPKCGTKYNSLLSGCPVCDSREPIRETHKPSSSDGKTMGIIAIVLGVFIPFIGFLLGIIGLKKFKNDRSATPLFIVSIILSVCWFVISIFTGVLV